MPTQEFPFGRPVKSRPPSSTDPCSVYLLGAYPSGLHIGWTAPALDGHPRRSIRALIVDNEPTPFWDGIDEKSRLDDWLEAVSWDQKQWGDATLPPPKTNGSSGGWVDEHILDPLGFDRHDVCISDCLDTARLNKSQRAALDRAYKPVAAALGLPECTMLPGPGENEIVRESQAHCERLRQELRDCGASTVITLGNAALKVMRTVLDTTQDCPGPDDGHPRSVHKGPRPSGPPAGRLNADGYGATVSVPFEDKTVTWYPLVHPGQRAKRWRDVHRRWEKAQP